MSSILRHGNLWSIGVIYYTWRLVLSFPWLGDWYRDWLCTCLKEHCSLHHMNSSKDYFLWRYHNLMLEEFSTKKAWMMIQHHYNYHHNQHCWHPASSSPKVARFANMIIWEHAPQDLNKEMRHSQWSAYMGGPIKAKWTIDCSLEMDVVPKLLSPAWQACKK